MRAQVVLAVVVAAVVAALAHVASTVNAQWRPPGKPMPLGSLKQCVVLAGLAWAWEGEHEN